ncbi:glucose 1-dehydrogenase [Spongiibacter nanhainus]|uniref:Glucose 1-dehydrogenase n=1 Tax=Spongiibacter nanhainus TaxID=2794344 RepID=A0A7T4QYV8_9GAMM|nr:glucose 1-dehydrogenase [Spongiibacter nanhainus]QQD17306.1 glucose 1-dehydrogenase [Spongiibacter nanhainus]
MSFENKVVIVTGAAQGMGAAYSRLLSQRGVSVAVADINLALAESVVAEITEAGGKALAVKVDVGSPESCKECVAATVAAFGKVNYLVNNAGLLSAALMPQLQDISLDDYQRVMSVNMHSVLYMTQAVVPELRRQGGGAIVNTSSIGSWQATGIYSVSKAGVNSLSVNLAHSLAADNIRVNAIAPGTVDTEGMKPIMSVEQMAAWAKMSGQASGQVAGPELIAQVGVFLLSDEAAFVNGQIFPVDGGTVIRI